MSLPLPSYKDDQGKLARLPRAYGGCTCMCHRTPGVHHVMPCCYPEKKEMVRVYETKNISGDGSK